MKLTAERMDAGLKTNNKISGSHQLFVVLIAFLLMCQIKGWSKLHVGILPQNIFKGQKIMFSIFRMTESSSSDY